MRPQYVVKKCNTRAEFEIELNALHEIGYTLSSWKWNGDFVAIFIKIDPHS